MKLDTIIDLLMFRESTDADNYSVQPAVTLGSIIWGVLLRGAIIIFLSIIIIQYYELYQYWWTSLFVLWLLTIYPGWNQYVQFTKRMEEFEESTLCGTCKHFLSSSQLCKIYDEHVSKNYIPCEGDAWEPK